MAEGKMRVCKCGHENHPKSTACVGCKEPLEEENPMLHEEDWQKFRETGLMFFINQILHAFGWALTVEVDEDGKATRAYPARTKFRGFGQESIERGYKKIATFLKENAEELCEEAHDETD